MHSKEVVAKSSLKKFIYYDKIITEYLQMTQTLIGFVKLNNIKLLNILVFVDCSCWIYISWVNFYTNCIGVTSHKFLVSIVVSIVSKSHFSTRN